MPKKTKSHLSPHDRYIRHVLSNIPVAREFFEKNLPQSLKSVIDLSSLVPQNESYIDDHLKLQVADILYSVSIQGKPGYIYCLIEHASTPNKWLPFRLLKYMLAIMDAHIDKKGHDTLPLVYPMVLYTGTKPFTYSMDLLNLFDEQQKELAREILWNPYHLIDLNKISDEEIREQYVYFGAAALIAKHIHDGDILGVLKPLVGLLRKLERSSEINYTMVTLQYIAESGSVPNREAFEKIVTAGLTEAEKETLMKTLAEQWKEEAYVEGLEKGTLEGLQKGKLEGKLEIAMSLFADGLSIEKVSQLTGLSIDKIKQFQKRTQH